MAGSQVHFFFRDVRRFHAHVTGSEFRFFREFFQFLGNRRAFGQPERQAGPDIFRINDEQPHLRADLAMVPAFGLLQHVEVGLHLGLVLEGGAVDALELRIAFVAFVVGAGHVCELESADVAGAHHVRPGAQINEIAVLVVGDRLLLRNVLDDVQFEFARNLAVGQSGEAAFACVFPRLLARDDPFLEGMIGFDLFLHLLLDFREILGRDAVRKLDVVIKAVLDRRAGGELGVGPEAQDGGGEHVGAGMPDALQFGHLRAVV